jgi:hypothetical protein
MVATTETPQKLTASESVLLAASDLVAAGNDEFSEWDLTVAAWSRDRFRFGLRGYAQTYPDHKRVMMEIMGKKPSNPLQRKFFEKVRPNYYRLTPLGRATAARIREDSKQTKPTSKPVSVRDLYESVTVYVNKPEFRRWQVNPEEPREWSGALAFLGLVGKDAGKVEPSARLKEVRSTFRAAIDWCMVQEAAFLTRGSNQGGTPIHIRDLSEMLDFLVALTYRFPDKLEPRTETKLRKRFED